MHLHPELCPCQLPLAQGPHSGTAASDQLNLTDTFPRPAPNWCPWHVFSEAGVCLGVLQPTQKPLKLPDFLSPCPLSNLLQSPESHQSWVARIHSRARTRKTPWLHCLPQGSPSLFICLAWAASAPHRALFCPPARVGPGSSCSPVPGWGEGWQEWTDSSEQSVPAKPQGNQWGFLLPYPTPQECGVTSFPPGGDCTAGLPWGFLAPKNLPCCSSTSKGFTPHQEQGIWGPAIPGSESSLKVPEGWREIQMHGNTDG